MAARHTENINKDTALSIRAGTRSSQHSQANKDTTQLDLTAIHASFEKRMDILMTTIIAQKDEIIQHIDNRFDKLETRIFDLEAKDEDNTQQHEHFETQLQELKDHTTKLERQLLATNTSLNHLDQHGRRWQVRIQGLPVCPDKYETSLQAKQTVCSFLHKSLSLAIQTSEIDCAHRVGKAFNGQHTMLVKFFSRDKIDQIISIRSKLKGTGLAIFEDATQLNRALCTRLYKHDLIANSWVQRGSVWATTKAGKKFKVNIADDIDDLIEKNAS